MDKKLYDITVGKLEKIVWQDTSGMFQTSENMLHYTEKDVPEDQIKLRTLELQKQAKVYLVNVQVMDKLKTAEQAAIEIQPYTDVIKKFKENNGISTV
jgi:hypothetical protein